MPMTNDQLERRIARLERELQAARGIGTIAKLRNKVNHGGFQSEHLANPTSNADSQNKLSSAGDFAPIGAPYVTTAADATLTNESILTGTTDEVKVTGSTISLEDAVGEEARRWGLMIIIGSLTGG